MLSLREDFNLLEYTDEFVDWIIEYGMSIYKNRELYEYYIHEEITEMENCSREDVRKDLTATAYV